MTPLPPSSKKSSNKLKNKIFTLNNHRKSDDQQCSDFKFFYSKIKNL